MRAYRTKNEERGNLTPLEQVEMPLPEPAGDEVQVRINAIGVNRADYFVRMGWYSLDEADKDRVGAEMSGVITAIGSNVTGWNIGDEVCAVTKHAGAYAEYATTPADFLLKKPDNLSFEEAASLPVGLLTGWYNIFMKGGLKEGQKILVQGGTSGMGVLAIQMAKAMGADVFATAGGADHCKVCEELGATAIDYQTEKFEDHGPYDVIFDIMGGGEYFRRNLESLAVDGNLRVLSFLGGGSTDKGIKLRELHKPGGNFQVSKSKLLEALKIGEVEGKVKLFEVLKALKERYPDESDLIKVGGDATRRWDRQLKAKAVEEIQARIMPLVGSGTIRTLVEAVYPFEEADRAHEHIAKPSGHVGKLVLVVSSENGIVR